MQIWLEILLVMYGFDLFLCLCSECYLLARLIDLDLIFCHDVIRGKDGDSNSIDQLFFFVSHNFLIYHQKM